MLVTMQEYAAIVGVSYSTVRSAVSRGRLKPIISETKRQMIESETPWPSQNTIVDPRLRGKDCRRLLSIFRMMKQRCYNPKASSYKRYGGRGIKICDEWLNNSHEFCVWAFDHGYREDLTIDRINNDGIYSPNNCRWVTHKEQAQNRSDGKEARRRTLIEKYIQECPELIPEEFKQAILNGTPLPILEPGTPE